MLCSECGKNEASVHKMTIINGVKTEQHLCAECAAKKNIMNTDIFSAGDFFKELFQLSGLPKVEKAVCSNCGMSLAQFEHTGELGCSECYKAFEKDIIPVLTSIHGNAVHTGEVPAEAGEEVQKRRKIAEIRKEISKAVAEENYERAAELRDELQSIERESENGSMDK